MSRIEERLDKVRELIQDDDFLGSRGLSNEVNIRIFCYEPEDEMAVRYFVEQITTDQTLKCHLVERTLYDVFLSICDDLGITDAIPEMEEEDGSTYLLEQIHSSISCDDFAAKMDYQPHQPGDVLLLTGLGEVFPFMRLHVLLDALQSPFYNTPILAMYPGKFDGHEIKLFNRLRPNSLYRAFNVI